MTGEASLIGAIACLSTINMDTNLSKGSLEHQLYLSALPLLRQGKLMLI